MECTIKNESACDLPKVCYEIKNESDVLISSYCGCISNYGRDGEDCKTNTVFTYLYIVWLSLLSLISFFFLLYGIYFLFPKYYVRNTMKKISAWFALIGLGIHCIYLFVHWDASLDPLVYPRSIDGLRVGKSWELGFYLLFLDVFFVLLNIAFVSVSWYEIAIASMRFKTIKDSKRSYCISISFTLVVFILSLILFILGFTAQLYYVWGVVGIVAVLLWIIGSFYITSALKQITSTSNNNNTNNNNNNNNTNANKNEYIRILKHIRKHVFITGFGIILAFTGSLLQTSRTLPGHELEPLSTLPKWGFGIALSYLGLSITFISLLLNGIDHVSNSNHSNTKTIAGVVSSNLN